MKKLVFVTIISLLLTVFGEISGPNDNLKPSLLSTPAFAATAVPKAKPFYEGKTITFVAASAPGGGTDRFTRLFARFLPRFIPGKPNIIVENMPGGGTIVGSNYVYMKAKPDGLTILTASGTSNSDAQRINQQGVLFDMKRMHILIGTASSSVCYVSSETGIRQPRDVVSPKGELIMGGTTRSTSLEQDIIMTELFKVKQYRPVYGYDNMGAARLAFMRRETNMQHDNTVDYASDTVKQLIQTGRAVPVFQSGLLGPRGEITRHPVASDVPTVAELYQQIYGIPPSGIVWDVLRDLLRSKRFNKIMAFAPGVPLQRVEEVEQAIRDLVKDPEWTAESKRVNEEALVPPNVVIGEEVQRLVSEYLAVSPEILRWLDNWMKQK